LKRIVRSLGAESSSTKVSSFWPIGLRFIQRFRLATQSAPRTGSPSWNFSPDRSVMVTVLPSSSVTAPSAICGVALKSDVMP